MYSSSAKAFNRSARIRICRELSSPVTYKTFRPPRATLAQTAKVKLDLPTPGSPAIRIIEPGISPPPNTLSSSPEPVINRGNSSISTSAIRRGVSNVVVNAWELFVSAGATSSSTSVFQLPHAGHLPSHLADSAPHSWQTYLTFFLANEFQLLITPLA